MTSTDMTWEEPRPKRSILPVIIGICLAVIGGGGGFYLVYSGMLFGGESVSDQRSATVPPLLDTTFVALDPMVVSLGPFSENKHLRFTAHLEVNNPFSADIEQLRPRIMDVLNSYLRAIETRDFDDVSALTRLRAQMLRRLQIVAGDGRIRDLLIVEFVLN